ncbi:MAG: DNA gyrase C-terminal beta-propeller domain-containing protein, partial [Patescibacteria group bacterium]
LDTKEEDFVTQFLTASTHSDLLFFTDRGKAYQIKMYDIPEGKRATRGKSIMNFLSLSEGERVTSILPIPKNVKENKDLSLLMITSDGVGKRVSAGSFHDVRTSGIIAIKLQDRDKLVSVSPVEKGDSCILVTAKGQSIRFKESDVREMGRQAGGVRTIKLDKGDHIIGAHRVKKSAESTAHILVVGANGYGKKTIISEYKIQKRGGSGIKTASVTAKTGEIIASAVVTGEEEEAVAMSKKSQVIRLALSEIPSLGRSTQGVRIMKLRDGDFIASFICL